VVACDTDRHRAREFASRWQVPAACARHSTMLRNGGLDAVIVATPDFAHRRPVCECLAAGLPVLCEKPLAMTLEDAAAIVDAQRASGAPLMVNFGNRHRPNAQRVRELIHACQLGRIEYISVRLNERLCKTRQLAWLSRTSPVWFLLSHCVDLVRWLLADEFEEVYARSRSGVVSERAQGVPDLCSALCTMGNGTSVHLESCWTMPDGYSGDIDFALEVIGEEGAIHADLFPHDLQLHQHDASRAQDYSMSVALASGKTIGWWEESTRSFFRALQAGATPRPTAAEGLEVTRTLCALDESLRRGAAVRVAEVG
jgi:predicted dehydrogenase